MAKIKCNDEVIVLAGRDKGKRGTVNKMLGNDRIIVTGVNRLKKHVKPNPQMGISGGIIESEGPIQISNVAIFNSESNKADRVGYRVLEDGRKVRIYKSSGEQVDA